jgi:hypothetical protein
MAFLPTGTSGAYPRGGIGSSELCPRARADPPDLGQVPPPRAPADVPRRASVGDVGRRATLGGMPTLGAGPAGRAGATRAPGDGGSRAGRFVVERQPPVPMDCRHGPEPGTASGRREIRVAIGSVQETPELFPMSTTSPRE